MPAINQSTTSAHSRTPARIPAAKGLYLLLIDLDESVDLDVGSLGSFEFESGLYAYVGSARGPGGLAARLDRHLRDTSQKGIHWHIDHLLTQAAVWGVAWGVNAHTSECEWSKALERLGLRWPPRFGSSDCRCAGHLIGFNDAITVSDLIRVIPERLQLTRFEIANKFI